MKISTSKSYLYFFFSYDGSTMSVFFDKNPEEDIHVLYHETYGQGTLKFGLTMHYDTLASTPVIKSVTQTVGADGKETKMSETSEYYSSVVNAGKNFLKYATSWMDAAVQAATGEIYGVHDLYV